MDYHDITSVCYLTAECWACSQLWTCRVFDEKKTKTSNEVPSGVWDWIRWRTKHNTDVLYNY